MIETNLVLNDVVPDGRQNFRAMADTRRFKMVYRSIPTPGSYFLVIPCALNAYESSIKTWSLIYCVLNTLEHSLCEELCNAYPQSLAGATHF